MSDLHYTGIGSRATPANYKSLFKGIAKWLALSGYTLRSGGANGPDSWFEDGCSEADGKKEIYLPWKGFNDNNSSLYSISGRALEIAEMYHPSWFMIRKESVKKLMARNSYQVLGKNLLVPSKFVICFGLPSSGTQQALRIAKDREIPVLNYYEMKDKTLPETEDYFFDFMEKSGLFNIK